MALVDCTITVSPSRANVSTSAATTVVVKPVTSSVVVTGMAGVRGPKGDMGPQGISIVPYVSDTPPDPDEHPLWLDSTTSVLYFWYSDLDSEQWVSIAGGTGPQGLPGPAGADGLDAPTYARRHDYAAPFSYCGKAVEGSAESDPVWTIARIELAIDGTTTTTHAADVAWTNRLTVSYQ